MDKSHDNIPTPSAGAPLQPSANPVPSQANGSARPIASPTQSSTAQNQTNSNLAFRSEYIGQWNAKQEDPFAEQNRKAAAKKAAQEATRKKILPFVKYGSIAAACIAAITILVVIIINVTKPTPIADLTPEESLSMSETAQEIFEKRTQHINLEDTENLTEKEKEEIQKAFEEADKYYDKQAERAENGEALAQVLMNKVSFYLWNNQPELALEASKEVSLEGMTSATLSNYYGQMQSIYAILGDEEQADYYLNLMIEVIGEDNYVEG